MKSLTRAKSVVSADGKSITITADLIDKDYSLILAQKISIGYLNPKHLKHPRLVQLSNEGIFVKSYGHSFAFDFDDLIAIATQVNPKTSFPPVFQDSDSPSKVITLSELPVTYQWQTSADKHTNKATKWDEVAGNTTDTLTDNSVPKEQWVRCVATNAAGSTISNPKILK